MSTLTLSPAREARPVPNVKPVRVRAPRRAPGPLDPTGLCCAVVRAAYEVMVGQRTPAQLTKWVSPEVMAQLTHRQLTAGSLPTGSLPTGPLHVRRVCCDWRDKTAEAAVILESHGHLRAAAVRLEVHRGAWRVTVLEIG